MNVKTDFAVGKNLNLADVQNNKTDFNVAIHFFVYF